MSRAITHSGGSGWPATGGASAFSRCARWALQFFGASAAMLALALSASAAPPSFFSTGISAFSVSFTSARSAISAGKFLPISQSRRPIIATLVVSGSGSTSLHTDICSTSEPTQSIRSCSDRMPRTRFWSRLRAPR